MTIQFFPAKIRWSPKKKKKRSSPKFRVNYRPKSKIQTIFPPKIRWSPKKKKKKVFAKIQSESSAEIQNSNVFSAQKIFFRIQLPDKKCFLRFVYPEIRISRIRNSTLYNPTKWFNFDYQMTPQTSEMPSQYGVKIKNHKSVASGFRESNPRQYVADKFLLRG